MARVSPIGRRTKTRPAAVRWFWATLSSPKHPSRRRNSICTTRSTRSSWRPPGRRRDSRILSSPARAATAATVATATTVVPVLAAISFSHLLNDTIQSLLPAIYPILKSSYDLSFAQIGLITLTLNATASILQPLVGLYTDRRATPYSLVVGMTFSLAGLLLLSVAWRFGLLLLASGLVGVGSAAMSARRSGHYWRHSSCCLADSEASRGLRAWRCWPLRCCGGSASGTRFAARSRVRPKEQPTRRSTAP